MGKSITDLSSVTRVGITVTVRLISRLSRDGLLSSQVN
jgi:hypothetical protein